MSEIISFHLDRNNPREAKALSILDNKRAEGLSVREILTQALINIDELSTPNQSLEPGMLEEMLMKLNRFLDRDFEPHHPQNAQNQDRSELGEEFILSVQNAAKPGIRASDLINT